jgi:hypothetical protein
MESSHGRVATSTREAMKVMCGADTDRCIGLMGATIKVSGSMGSSTEKVTLF